LNEIKKQSHSSISPPFISQQKQQWLTISARIRKNDLPLLNKRLEMNGFNTFNEFVRAWIKGEYPKFENNEQVEKMLIKLREGDIKDPVSCQFSPSFYRSIDRQDMLNDLSKKYIYKKHAKDLVGYFDRYSEIFFTNPQLIRGESGHKRAWICDAMRRFGEYYDRRFNNPQLKLLISEIIQRYELNKKMRIHDRLWLTDQDHLSKMIHLVLTIPGDIGILIKFALYTGLRGEEIAYVHKTQICDKLFGCNCSKLHVVEKKKNGGYFIIVINRIVGQKHCYFTIVPTKLWLDFKALPNVDYEQRKVSHGLLKSMTDGKVSFMDLRKFHYNVLCRSDLKESGAEVLEGRAKSVSAKHYLLHEVDKMVEQYHDAWETLLSPKL
jgi:intergrase/recombinase